MSETELRRGIFSRGILVFAGDCDIINYYLHGKSDKSIFLLPRYVNSLLRSFGYVIFANNPISGLLILASILAADPASGITAIICSSLSYFFALMLRQDCLGNLNGFFGYNAVLLGTHSVGLLPRLYPDIQVDEPKFWFFLIFTAFLSVYFTSALANLFRYLGQHPIPCFLLPFNLLQYILIFCLLNNTMPPTILSRHLIRSLTERRYDSLSVNSTTPNGEPAAEAENLRSTETTMEPGNKILEFGETPELNLTEYRNESEWNWGHIYSGTMLSVTQIYGLSYVPGSAFMMLALLVYSPTSAIFCYSGAVLGTLLGMNFAANHEEIYNGLWGYNGFLCGGALAGFGFVLTWRSGLLALTAVVFSTLLQHYLTPLFLLFDVPVFTVPFNVTALLFLFVTSDSDGAFPRPANFTFPEKHRYEFTHQCRRTAEVDLKQMQPNETYTSKDEV